MAFIDRMKGQDYIEKTRAYLDYLEEHLENVRKAFCDLSVICDGMWWVGDDLAWHTIRDEVEWHDISKFSKEEFVQYRDSFFPVNDKDKKNSGMAEAWDHHKKENQHHHETVRHRLDVIHMVIDWTAMGYKFRDTAQEYYEANKGKIILTEDQIETMYEVFDRIRERSVV